MSRKVFFIAADGDLQVHLSTGSFEIKFLGQAQIKEMHLIGIGKYAQQ